MMIKVEVHCLTEYIYHFSQNIFECLFKECSESVFVSLTFFFFFACPGNEDTSFNIGPNDVSCNIKVDSDKLPLQDKKRCVFILVFIIQYNKQQADKIPPLD